MNAELTIDSAGRIVLASSVRRLLHLRPGSTLRLAVVAERIELTPEPQPEAALALSPSRRRVLEPAGEPFDAAAATRAERAAQAQPHKSR